MAKWSQRSFVTDEDDVSLALLDEPEEIESDLNDKELHDFVSTACFHPICFLPHLFEVSIMLFWHEIPNILIQANWLGGSYVGTLDALDGELTLPLASGMHLKLHMSKVFFFFNFLRIPFLSIS